MVSVSVVEVTEGIIQGCFKIDSKGDKYHVFLGIPYAKPPLGNLRFKAPQAAEKWEGVKDVTKLGDMCIQKPESIKEFTLTGSEDCLHLNIFTKKLPSEDPHLKPVFVFIHGGGFLTGSNDSNIYAPDYFITEDIVIVSITYRVGILGFLRLQDTSLEVPGNTGLKDQVEALKWIKKNIKQFNGDPENVTICGESAGGASVEYLILSSTAKNLFKKAIIMSGSTLNPWARGRFDAADFAKRIGHPDKNERELLEFLTHLAADELLKLQTKYLEQFDINLGWFCPVIEKPNPSAFITKHPIDIIQSREHNDVPVMMGYCDKDGYLIPVFNHVNKFMGIKPIEYNFNHNIMPYDTNFEDESLVTKMSEKLKRFYDKPENKHDDSLILTDGMFVSGIMTSALNQAKFSSNPVYFYRFSFDGKLNFLKVITNFKRPGACHADELGYLFKASPLPPLTEVGEAEKLTQYRMIKLWTNFIKYGNPTPKGNDLNTDWKSIEGDKFNYLSIGNELKLDVDPDAERWKLWKEIFKMNPATSKFLYYA